MASDRTQAMPQAKKTLGKLATFNPKTYQRELDELKSDREEATEDNIQRWGVDFFKDGNGVLTDVTIKCKDEEWGAHRHILVERCGFFRACLQPGFTEHDSRVIHMDDDDPEACRLFLQFLYHDEVFLEFPYKDKHYRDQPRLRPFVIDIHHTDVSSEVVIALSRMADKYNLPAIFERLADLFLANPGVTRMADLHGADQLNILIAVSQLNTSAELLLFREILIQLLACKWQVRKSVGLKLRARLEKHADIMFEIFQASLKTSHSLSSGDCVGEVYCKHCHTRLTA